MLICISFPRRKEGKETFWSSMVTWWRRWRSRCWSRWRRGGSRERPRRRPGKCQESGGGVGGGAGGDENRGEQWHRAEVRPGLGGGGSARRWTPEALHSGRTGGDEAGCCWMRSWVELCSRRLAAKDWTFTDLCHLLYSSVSINKRVKSENWFRQLCLSVLHNISNSQFLKYKQGRLGTWMHAPTSCISCVSWVWVHWVACVTYFRCVSCF